MNAYTFGECVVIATLDPTVERGLDRARWHLSISHKSRYPTWDEIRDARYKFLPLNITIAMILPPPSEYVNVHPNCFHLHEIPSEQEIARP
jgi:hypothetical protein